jgi:acyl-CoA synthetase (AMP-forming)/AMP-acid ligase II
LSLGIGRGDKIAILLMNCLEWLPIYFGILKAGALAVPLNFRYTAEEIKHCLELSESRILVFGPEFIGRMEEIVDNLAGVDRVYFVGEDCPSFADSYEKSVAAFPISEPGVSITDEDNAAIYFSSGTTGFPKAILHKHKSLSFSCEVENNHHGQKHDDVFLCIPPLYHTGAKMHWFGSFLVGGRSVILRGIKPEWILQTVSEEKCTIVWLLVPWAQDILDAIKSRSVQLSDYELEQWRLMHIGAQPVPPSLIKSWKEIFPHHDYDTNYGLSESIGPGCVHLGIENIHKVGAIGIPGFGWQAEIRKESGGVVQAGSDDVGELCVKGDGLMSCYFNDIEATEEVLKDGWLYTGDMARLDKDNFIFLVDRKKDVIITGGENIYPVQIEDFFHSHPAIKDVAVIGVPDKRLGEIAAAVVELKPDNHVSAKELEDFALQLPRYKRPRKYIFESVPRNATGKIEKPLLRERHAADRIVERETT